MMKNQTYRFKYIKFFKNYDTIHNSDYTDTLKTYIKANYNISEAARLSNLHRQSLIYRLDKIEALTGLSLKTMRICLHLSYA